MNFDDGFAMLPLLARISPDANCTICIWTRLNHNTRRMLKTSKLMSRRRDSRTKRRSHLAVASFRLDLSSTNTPQMRPCRQLERRPAEFLAVGAREQIFNMSNTGAILPMALPIKSWCTKVWEHFKLSVNEIVLGHRLEGNLRMKEVHDPTVVYKIS